MLHHYSMNSLDDGNGTKRNHQFILVYTSLNLPQSCCIRSGVSAEGKPSKRCLASFHCTPVRFKMAATPSTAVSNSLSLVNANADAPRSADPLGPPSRIARRSLPPTPSLAPAGSSLPTIQPNVAAVAAGAPRPGAGRRRLAAPVCCRCNRQGKCKNCVCVKQGRVCINCLPSRVGGCQNLDVPALPSAPSPVPGPPPSSSISLPDPPSAASISVPNPPPQPIDHMYAPSPPTPPLQRLPSWDSIFALRCSTLQHVPKGARDVWADLITGVFSAIVDNPSNSDNWLAKDTD